jgi:hypothetical protein
MSEPRWQHDCDSCEFLGPLDLKEPKEELPSSTFDVYWCPSETFRATIVLRYAADGPDYASSAFDILYTRIAKLRRERFSFGVTKPWDILWWKTWWFLVEQKKVKNWSPNE